MKRMKKLLSVFLVTVIVALTMAPVSMAAVQYPQGVTAEQAESAIGKTDTLIYSVLKQTQNTTLKQMFMPVICSSETLSMLTLEVYKMVEQNAESISMLGLDTTPAAVAAYLVNYPEAAQKIAALTSWEQADLSGVNWGVSTKEQMAEAAAAVFGPFNELLYTLLCAGKYSLNILVGINGDYGYQNAVVPILRNLGCQNYTDPAVFCQDAEADRYSMVRHIVLDLMGFVEGILDAPCSRLTEILPGIAYFINNGGMDNALQSLISPLKVELLSFELPIDIQSAMDSQETEGGFTVDINLGDMMSVSDFKMAELDMETIAACGTVSGDTVISNKGETFIVLLRWIFETLKLNQASIPSMLGENASEDLVKILNSLLSKTADELITVIIGLFNQTSAVINDYQWFFNDNPTTQVSYTPNLGQDKYQRVLDGIDELINEFVKESGEAETIRETLQPQIYSNSLVSELAVQVYSMLTSDQMKQMTSLLGISLSPSALAAELTEEKFAATRNQLNKYYSWSVVKPESITWGFRNGDKDGFVDAMSAVFRPLDEMLRMMLAGGKIQLFGAVDLYGSDGYNTAIIPLLEAFGVYGDSIPGFTEYTAAIQNQDVMKPILQSLASLIERVLDKPVYTITEILPNLLYFINNNGIEIVMKNLLHPVMKIMEQLGLSDMLNLSQITEGLDINSLMKDMLGSMELGMTLPDLDLNQFQGMGTLTSVASKRTQQGNQIMIYTVDSDQTAVLITLLRYFVGVMKTPGNEDMMTSFMGGSAEGGNDMFASYSGGITEELAAMTTDETVEWLYKIFFRERAVVEEKAEDYLPTIIYEEEFKMPWGNIFTTLLFIVIIGLFLGLANRDRIRILLDELKEKKQLKAQAADTQEV
ncbi:MAG: hypothetical protein IJ491_02635 [Clostridia bacterium]|nr:hypothetical protein [Clostridia bacterium]